MKHPLESVPREYRAWLFFAFLLLTVILFAVFRILDQPLRTDAAPNGIVSFELARTPQQARTIVDVWDGRTTIYTEGENSNAITTPPGEPFVYNELPIIYAAFGLGIDYLFMPAYSLALAFGILLAMQKHTGWIKSMGAVAGYGVFAAALFDAVENLALLQVLSGAYESSYPAIAAFCASIKFGLLIFGLVVAIIGWLLPSK